MTILPALESLAVTLDDHVLGVAGHIDDRQGRHCAFEAGESGLRSDIGIINGVAIAGLLQDGIRSDLLSVVAVRVALRESEHPLPEEIEPEMDHLPGLPVVGNVARQALRQAESAVEGGEQRKAAAGALARLIEARVGGTAEEVFEMMQARAMTEIRRPTFFAASQVPGNR